MPECIIAVTGSNGKTSTVEMIRGILEKSGKTVACNSEGSNQIEGAATLILSNSTNSGVFRKDVLLLETDERYAKYIFKYFAPTYYVINNLYYLVNVMRLTYGLEMQKMCNNDFVKFLCFF